MSVQIAKRLFNVEEYDRMGEAGIFHEDDRVELIEGEIIEMSPIGERHAACVDLLAELLREQLQRKVIIRVQSPIQLGAHSEPQPDLALLKRRDDFYRDAHPTPVDVLLVVEVSDTTVEYDRQIKVPAYARAGIEEVWLVNLKDDRIELYVQPAGGAYQSINNAQRGETAASQSIPGLALEVDAVLG
jgi:Uma2 family endonuclease